MEKQQFIQLINAHQGVILSLCKVYYTRNEDQQDAFQEIVYQLWKSIDNFNGKSKISTWIYRVSLNTILNDKRKADKSIDADSIDSKHQSLPSIHADDNLELLHLIIQTLKGIDKAIVILHLEGYRNKEIAEILQLSASNVSTRFNRIKSTLKVKFNSQTHATERS